MKRYKLIREYPGSRKTGTVVEPIIAYDASVDVSKYIDRMGKEYGWHEIEDFPEYWELIEESKFKVGDWIYVLDSGFNDTGNIKYSKSVYKGDIFRIAEFGKQTWDYDYDDDKYSVAIGNDGEVVYTGKYPDQFRLATKDEIEKVLIAEAKKRGYKTGVRQKIIPAFGSIECTIICTCDGYKYYPDADRLDTLRDDKTPSCTIYYKGQWAEIIEQQEPIVIGGYKAEFLDDAVRFGCRQYSKKQVFDLLGSMNIFRVISIDVDNGGIINRDTIYKIYNRMKK
ncbi:hypothetical protein [Immundisolibacter sp.]